MVYVVIAPAVSVLLFYVSAFLKVYASGGRVGGSRKYNEWQHALCACLRGTYHSQINSACPIFVSSHMSVQYAIVSLGLRQHQITHLGLLQHQITHLETFCKAEKEKRESEKDFTFWRH